MKELKPCPFCGGDAKLAILFTDSKIFEERFFVGCVTCLCNTHTFSNKQMAIQAWNKRTAWCGDMITRATLLGEERMNEVKSTDLLAFVVRVYNQGYKAGHHDTVEGGYVDIFDCDMNTYHEDVVREIINEDNMEVHRQVRDRTQRTS